MKGKYEKPYGWLQIWDKHLTSLFPVQGVAMKRNRIARVEDDYFSYRWTEFKSSQLKAM